MPTICLVETFASLRLQQPVVTIKTRVFLIGVLQISSIKNQHRYTQHELEILQAFASEAALIQIFFEDLKFRRTTETVITQIMLDVSTTTGEDFFKAIIGHLSKMLQADACVLVILEPGKNDSVKSLAYFFDGELVENITYPLKGTPCETVIGQQARTYTSGIEQSFPHDSLIRVADETGQILQLSEFIQRQACALTSELWCSSSGCDELDSLSVNISPRQFQQDDFITKFEAILKQENAKTCCVEVEVTENILIEDTRKVSEKLQKLNNMGLKISIDDFGTGYASLRYL